MTENTRANIADTVIYKDGYRAMDLMVKLACEC